MVKILLAFILSISSATMKRIMTSYGYYLAEVKWVEGEKDYIWHKPATDDSVLIGLSASGRLSTMIFSVNLDNEGGGEEAGEIAGKLAKAEYDRDLLTVWFFLVGEARNDFGTPKMRNYRGYTIVTWFKADLLRRRLLWASGFYRR